MSVLIKYSFWKHDVLLFGALESDNEDVWMQIVVKVYTAFFPRNIIQDNFCHNSPFQSGIQTGNGKLFGQPYRMIRSMRGDYRQN